MHVPFRTRIVTCIWWQRWDRPKYDYYRRYFNNFITASNTTADNGDHYQHNCKCGKPCTGSIPYSRNSPTGSFGHKRKYRRKLENVMSSTVGINRPTKPLMNTWLRCVLSHRHATSVNASENRLSATGSSWEPKTRKQENNFYKNESLH